MSDDQREPSNDNGLGWRLTGPDQDGRVWLVDDRPGGNATNLGQFDEVAEAVAAWLAERDFGER